MDRVSAYLQQLSLVMLNTPKQQNLFSNLITGRPLVNLNDAPTFGIAFVKDTSKAKSRDVMVPLSSCWNFTTKPI